MLQLAKSMKSKKGIRNGNDGFVTQKENNFPCRSIILNIKEIQPIIDGYQLVFLSFSSLL